MLFYYLIFVTYNRSNIIGTLLSHQCFWLTIMHIIVAACYLLVWNSVITTEGMLP